MSDKRHIERLERPAAPAPEYSSAMNNAIELLCQARIKPLAVKSIPALDYDAQFGDGRFAFRLDYHERSCIVQIPGVPVCYLRDPDPGNPYSLYVDEIAVTWLQAVEAIRRILWAPHE